MYQLCKLGISDTILCITISVIISLHITHSFCAIVKFRHSDGAGMYDISGIEEKMGDGRDGAISPFLKQGIKLSAALAYISGRDAVAPTNLIHHIGDFAGRNTLQIHLGNSEVERPVNSRASFKPGDDGSLRIPYLRDIQSNLPGGSPNGARFEAITLAIPRRHALVTLTA